MRDLSHVVESAKEEGIDAALRSLGEEAAAMGVKLRLRYDDRAIALDHIQRSADTPKGTGAVVMEALCGIADQCRMRITLYASEASDTLLGYYGRFGFETDPRGDDEAMLRRLAKRRPRSVSRPECGDDVELPAHR